MVGDGEAEDGASGAVGPDARFEDEARPARVLARDPEDLRALSALLQDAVAQISDIAWLRKARRFALVVNRYRWEEPSANERVRAGLHFNGVLGVRARGVAPAKSAAEPAPPLSILSIEFEPAAEPPGGVVRVSCAGEAEFLLDVEALDASMKDMSKPWAARAKPRHPGA